jgi:predicted MPP superfamily phosphohydrolase
MPPVPILAAVYIWHLLVMPLTVVSAVVIGLIRGGGKIVSKVRGKRNENQPPVEESGPSRREVITAAAAGVPPLVTAGLVGIALPQLNDFRLAERDVPVANLPAELEGLTIAHVSDVHVGKYTKGRVLEEIVEKVNAMSADLVVFSGDLIDFSMKDLPRGIEMIKALRGKFGLFMCEGNHDLFEDPQGFERQVKDAGLNLLLNENQIVRIRGQALQIVGIRWSSGALVMRDLYAAMPRRRDDVFPILVAHHPHAFDAADERGIPLTLAGHTHGGQLMLTRHAGAGPMLFRYWSGLYRKDSGASLVVSNGVGNWFPLRVGAPAEIVKLRLTRG